MKGVSDEVQLVAAIVLCCLVWVLVWPKMTQPSLESYGDGSAYFIAEMIAHDIDSLSTVDEGTMERTMFLEWDIIIKKGKRDYFVEVNHDDFSSKDKGSVPILADLQVDAIEIYNTKKILIEKKDGIVTVSNPDIEEEGAEDVSVPSL